MVGMLDGAIGWGSDSNWTLGNETFEILGVGLTDRVQLKLFIESGTDTNSILYYDEREVARRTHTQLSTYAQNSYVLFATVSGTDIKYYTDERIYYAKIYVNDELVRNFKPALDENNVACLYDTVTKQYYYNAGTGTFNYE